MKNTIELTISGTDFKFNVNQAMHGDYVDAVGRGTISAASHNLVMRAIDDSQKEQFKKFIEDSPGATLQIASMLRAEYAPELTITVKK
ncbi:putative phage tail assembly chaperone [Shewanella putrefaciens]|nr:putative phage tail assembly chaperone [Shewanella putrefaciens]